MRAVLLLLALLLLSARTAPAQVTGKWPPDSLVNTKVIPHDTPVIRVVGTMRDIATALGVRCSFCHEGEEGKPLTTYDFPSDKKRTKRVARQMMWMVQEINRRVDTIPERPDPGVAVACRTCHRGVNRPIPLSTIVAEATVAGGADSGLKVYRGLREKYFGRDAYDFGELSLNSAAFRVGREHRVAEALKLLDENERQFPGSSGMAVFRGNVLLMGGDTTAAAASYRVAIARDSTNREAFGRLRDIGRTP